MDILPLGHASFKLRGKTATVVTDPFDEKKMGIKFPRNVEADIVTVSHDHYDHNAVSAVGGKPFVVRGPGEYEIKGVSIIGVSSFHDEKEGALRGKNTMYRIEMDRVTVGHMGDLGHILTTSEVDALDGIDVLLIPVGGLYTIDAKTAAQVVSDIEPRIVIPMHDGRSNKELAPVREFLQVMNKGEITAITKLTVNREKLPGEMQIVVLE